MTEECPVDENRVLGYYAQSKARATGLVLAACVQGLDAVVVHPSGIIGPFDFKPSPIGQMILDFSAGKLPAYVNGAYDYVDVRSVAEGLLFAAQKGKAGQRYILSGEKMSVFEMMKTLEAQTGVAKPKMFIPRWLALPAAFFAELYYRLAKKPPRFTRYSIRVLASNPLISHEKAEKELGYRPLGLQQTFADTVSWFKETGRL